MKLPLCMRKGHMTFNELCDKTLASAVSQKQKEFARKHGVIGE